MLRDGFKTSTISGENSYDYLLDVNFVGATGNITLNNDTARRNGYALSKYEFMY